jgi:hypothetical protein
MSALSDKYEKDVAANINSIPGIVSERPSVGVDYPDVKITYNKKEVWLEVKMNHTDNLANPRVFFEDSKWKTTYKTPAAAQAVEILNASPQTKSFISEISKFSGIPEKIIKIPTTKGGLRLNGAVPLHIMKSYFDTPGINRYIVNKQNLDLGKTITLHYTKGKSSPAYYMQAGDDFYRISYFDPFNLGADIPLLSGTGDFKMRISTRSDFYEVQAEIKIIKMPDSAFSLKPGTKKLNPFLKQ